MTRLDIINKLIEDASTHNPNEIMCYIAGHRKDNGRSCYYWGEFLNALKTQEGYVWESNAKDMVDIIETHPEIFEKDFKEENISTPQIRL